MSCMVAAEIMFDHSYDAAPVPKVMPRMNRAELPEAAQNCPSCPELPEAAQKLPKIQETAQEVLETFPK